MEIHWAYSKLIYGEMCRYHNFQMDMCQYQGYSRGKFVAAAILPLRIEQSYCTSNYFFVSKPANQVELPFPCGQNHARIGCHGVNHAVTIIQIQRYVYNNSPPYVTGIWRLLHSVNTGVKKRPNSPLEFPWSVHKSTKRSSSDIFSKPRQKPETNITIFVYTGLKLRIEQHSI